MEFSTTARILMCPPDYFGIEYEINPWMNMQQGTNPQPAPAVAAALSDPVRPGCGD